MLPTERVSNGYLPGLDGLRALAIACVILAHANVVGDPFPSGRFEGAVARLLGAGWVGVDLFFVLSGFLITRILVAARGEPHFFRNFYMRRTLRIFPAYYLYAALMLFAMPALGGHLGSAEWRSGHAWDKASVLLYFYNVRVALTGHPLLLVNHLWSLAVEEHFYLVWPLVVAACEERTLMRLALLGLPFAFLCRLAVLHAHVPMLAAYELTPCHVEGLLLGGFLAVAWARKDDWERVRGAAPYTLAASALAIVSIAAVTGHFSGTIGAGDVPQVRSSAMVLLWGISAVAVFCASMLVFVLERGRLSRWLEQPLLRRVGRLSYGMYLYHLILLWVGYDALHASPLWHVLPMSVLKLGLAAFDLVASYGLAALSYRFLEAPFLRLKVLFPAGGRRRDVHAGLAL